MHEDAISRVPNCTAEFITDTRTARRSLTTRDHVPQSWGGIIRSAEGYGAVRNLSNRGWLPYLAVSGLTIISIFSRILHQKSSALFEWKDLTPRQTAFQ